MMYIDNEVLEKMIMTMVEGFNRLEKKLDRMSVGASADLSLLRLYIIKKFLLCFHIFFDFRGSTIRLTI